MYKVLFILEKNDNIDYSLATHADIEKISYYPNEREVLFFPFSSFEIKEIKEEIINNEKRYIIKLLYLGKYIKELENDITYTQNENIIADSEFKKQIIDSGLIKPNKNINNKQLFQKYKDYKNNLMASNKLCEIHKSEEHKKCYSNSFKLENKINENNKIICQEKSQMHFNYQILINEIKYEKDREELIEALNYNRNKDNFKTKNVNLEYDKKRKIKMYSNSLDKEYKTGVGIFGIFKYKYKIEYNGYWNKKTLEQFGKQYCSNNLIYEGFF